VRVLIAFVAEYLYIGILVSEALYVSLIYRNRWKELLSATLFISLIAFAISLIANRIIEDPRPFVVSGVQPLISSSSDNGFPSDHTLLLAATAAVILVVSRGVGILGLIAAFAVGMARVYARVHHIEDVLGSMAIAMIAFGLYEGIIWVWKTRNRKMRKPTFRKKEN
jgi:undecaprenyl-diphosphatase